MATVRKRLVERLTDGEREMLGRRPRAYAITNDRVLAMDLANTILQAALVDVMNELGVPNKDYPAPATNAWTAAKAGLNNAARL